MKKADNSQTKGDRTRGRILEAATELMAEKGPDAVSMREISAKLKITKPVLYYYFKDKDELIKAAFLEGTKHIKDLTFEVAGGGLSLEKKLEKIFANHLLFIRRYPQMPKCALKIMSSPEQGVLAEMARDLKLRNRATLREILAREELPAGGAESMIHLISAVITYFMVESRENGAASLHRDLPRRLARLLVAGAKAARSAAAGAALWALSAAPASAAPAVLSLDAAVKAALANNAAVVSAERTRDIYKEKVREYWGGVYPQLSAGAQYTRNIEAPSFFIAGNKIKAGLDNAYAASLNLDQVLWSGGKVYTAIRMANLYSEASDEQLAAARKNITRAVRQLYYSVLLARALAGIQEEALAISKEHLAMVQAQYAQGIASDLAVLRQKVEVSNTEPALTQARNLYEKGLLELKNLAGMDPDEELELSGGFDCAPREAAPADPLASRPDYLALRHQRDLYRSMVKIEKAGHLPYLGAFASHAFQGQSDEGFPGSDKRSWSTTAGLKLAVPIFSGGVTTSKVKQAELQALIADNNLDELARRIKIEVRKARLQTAEAAARLKSQQEAVAQARKALEATEVRFRNGLSGQLELNDATLALNRSQTLFTQARHDVCSADAELRWALGE
jgi:outer membrane protein